ncbi:ABC transporter permease [Rubripirellula amarantea]|nr:ABC transporter permease [Rubripirellula amarantea]
MSLKPYLAIISDSFRAALSSRVLWVAIVAIWLLLALLMPFGYREDFTTDFRWQDFYNGTRMKAMLARGLVDPDGADTPLGRIAVSLPEDLKRELQFVGEGDEVRIAYSVLVDALNGLLDDTSWYDADAWKAAIRLKELRELDALSDEELSASLKRRRSRLRIEAAMPGVFQARSQRAILLTYAGMDFPTGWAVDKPQFERLINQFVLPLMINWLLGFILVFLGILVTASIIPDMLQPGSLHLLLSKPISRTILLLAKFIGGCAFVLVCVTQLVLGLYLIAGFRLDIWNARLLLCIPVSVFLFSVFYSVSVLAGLRWRSPILAIGVTVIFGGICLLVGFIGALFDGLVKNPDQVRQLTVVGDDVFATTRGGGLIRFDDAQSKWIEIFESGPANADRVIAPIRLDDDHLITARIRNGRFNPFGSGAPELNVLSRTSDWVPEPSMRLPTATTNLFRAGEGSVLALNTGELSMTSRDNIIETATKEAAKVADNDAGETNWLSKLNSMIGTQTQGFHEILPERVSLSQPRSLVVADDGRVIYAVTGSRLMRLQPPSNDQESSRWTVTADFTLEGDQSSQAHLAISGERLLVTRSEQPAVIFDANTLNVIETIECPSGAEAMSVIGLNPDQQTARFLAVLTDGRIRELTSNGESAKWGEFIGPREAECVYFDPAKNRIYVAHHIDRVDLLSSDTLERQSTKNPSLSGWRRLDQWLITPLRTVIPQTGELGETVASMISGKTAVEINDGANENQVIRYKILRPVLSCSIFVLVMLTISCLYFTTSDF